METKFTKGPWKCDENRFVYDDNEKIICDLGPYVIQSQPVMFRPTEEVEANAKLISAAPELLQALIEINTMIANSCTENGIVINTGKLAEISIKAIKKEGYK